MCKTQPWSITIQQRRFRFLGHLLRADNSTPAKKALGEFLRPVLRDRGRPITTWWSIIIKDLKQVTKSVELKDLERLASDRKQWRELGRAMSFDGKR